MIKILDRYVAGIMVQSVLAVLIVLATFITLVVGVGDLNEMLELNVDFSTVVSYFFYYLPQEMISFIPIAVLMGCLIGTMALTRHGELAAILAAGIPLLRATAATWVLAVFMMVAMFFGNEWFVAPAYRQALLIRNLKIKRQEGARLGGGLLYKGVGNRVFHLDNIITDDQDRTTVIRLDMHEMSDDDRGLLRTVRADTAEWTPDRQTWLLRNGAIIDWASGPTRTPFASLELALAETPEQFGAFGLQPREMSFHDLAQLVSYRLAEGSPCTTLFADLHLKLAQPVSCIIMALIGVAAGASSFISSQSGAGRYAFSIGLCIAVALIYTFAVETMVTFARSGFLFGPLSIWIPNVLFFVFAVVYLARMRAS